MTRDNSDGRVWEYLDEDVGESEVELLRAIADSKEATVRFEGDGHYHDFTVTDGDKRAIRDALMVYEAYN